MTDNTDKTALTMGNRGYVVDDEAASLEKQKSWQKMKTNHWSQPVSTARVPYIHPESKQETSKICFPEIAVEKEPRGSMGSSDSPIPVLR